MTKNKTYTLNEYDARLIKDAFVVSSRFLYIELYDGRYFHFDLQQMSPFELVLIQLDLMDLKINIQEILDLYI